MTIKQRTNKNIVYIKGNIFDYIENYIKDPKYGSSIIVPHVCNNVNVFGGGFTRELSIKYPIVKENYHMLGNNFLKFNLGYTQYVEVLKHNDHSLVFANMIAQESTISKSNPRPLNYLALVKSMASVSNYIKQLSESKDDTVQIHCPKFGAGLAGGNWSFIEDLIEDIWYRHTIYIYSL